MDLILFNLPNSKRTITLREGTKSEISFYRSRKVSTGRPMKVFLTSNAQIFNNSVIPEK